MALPLKISWLSMNIFWEAPEHNLAIVAQYLSENRNIDLLVLPEMFSTGFTNNVQECAQGMQEGTVFTLKELASNYKVAIAGSMVIKEDGQYYNRFLFVKPNAEIESYDKHHLFTYAGEDKVYTAGNKHLKVEYKGWTIACFVCYDLRFPAWIRKGASGADLLLFVANWPSSRVEAWNVLLKARAIENQAYVVGVNRVGMDGNGLQYSESSQLISPDGVVKTGSGLIHELDQSFLQDFRVKFPFLPDADQFELER